MAAMATAATRHCHCVTKSKPFHCLVQFRTLVLNSANSQTVGLNRLSGPDSGIVEVSMNRPKAKNAFGKEMLRGLKEALEAVNGDPAAKVVMIKSFVPNVFCAGADLKEHKTDNLCDHKNFVNSVRSTFSLLEGLNVPTIAVIEGPALGGGLQLALSCDLRICGEDAMLGFPETGLAIIPAVGGTQRLSRLVGTSVAKELIFTGRRINGKEALSMGLVNYCVPTGEAHRKALEVAREINQKGPVAIRMTKIAIDKGMEMEMESALSLEEKCYERVVNTEDRLEGLEAFADVRKPMYSGK